MNVSLGREPIRQALAQTSERTYHGYFKYWKLFLLAGEGVDPPASLLLAYIAYAWVTNGLAAGTLAGHLVTVKFFDR